MKMDDLKLSELTVLHLWRITIRILNLIPSSRHTFYMTVANYSRNETDAIKDVRLRFTPEWWEDKIITSVKEYGELHMICGVALYEKH
jgi:hypothetical protein